MKKFLFLIFYFLAGSECLTATDPEKIVGIYLGQQSLSEPGKLDSFLQAARRTGINTFVVDLHSPDMEYKKSILEIQRKGIRYIARIVVFPGGATPDQLHSDTYLTQKLNLATNAVRLNADAVQLDYIRFSTKQKPSPENSSHILRVIKQFRKITSEKGTPLHIAVFGESLFFESLSIGQNLPLFAESIEAISPMVYPSHYFPYAEHSRNPYKTISDSLNALPAQFRERKIPFRIIPYIEMYNVRLPMNIQTRQNYIREQIRAVNDHSMTSGWIAWSAGNKYYHLFKVLESKKSEKHPDPMEQ